jgi:hypothetical protein
MTPQPVAPAVRVGRFFETVLWLIVLLGFLVVLMTGRLDAASVLAMGAALAVRLFRLLRVWVRPPIAERVEGRPDGVHDLGIGIALSNGLLSAIVIALVGFYPVDFLLVSGSFVRATLRLLFLFSALRLLTARTNREAFSVGMLAFLQLVAASLLVPGATFLGVLLIFVVLAVAAYAAFEMKHACETHARVVPDTAPAGRGALGGRLALMSALVSLTLLVFSLGLFFVLPRTLGGPAFPGLPMGHRVGFSQEVDLGATGSVRSDPTPVMRIESVSGHRLDGLYWRGVALRLFDGVRWLGSPASIQEVKPEAGQYLQRAPARRSSAGERIIYRVTLEPMSAPALFLTGVPEEIKGEFQRLTVTDTDSYLLKGSHGKPVRYEAVSWLARGRLTERARVRELFSGDFRDKYLRLPPVDLRILQLAREITADLARPLDRAQAIENYLRTRYAYTLDLPDEPSKDPVANFLFERREGHCEYFASAMAVMLRTLGIPSRLVNGFLGGVHNPFSGLQVVRSSDAHSWVEAYIPGYGWVSFDPTPPAPDTGNSLLMSQLWPYWDALQSAWGDWILDYDRGRQVSLARSFQDGARSAIFRAGDFAEAFRRMASEVSRAVNRAFGQEAGPGLSSALMALALAAALATGIWFARWLIKRLIGSYRAQRVARGEGQLNDLTFLYGKALAALESRGFRRSPWTTPEEFAASIEAPELRGLVDQLTVSYTSARFGRDTAAGERLPALVRALERAG